MTIKSNCDEWIDFTYKDWLNSLRETKGTPYLRESTRNLINRMKDASLDPSRNEEAWNMLERLKRLSESYNNLDNVSKAGTFNLEYPEVYLECALAAYKMGDIHEAQELIKVSIARFPMRSLNKALSQWLCGCIQWQLPFHLEEALLSWEQGMGIVKDAKLDNRSDAAPTWSQQRPAPLGNAGGRCLLSICR